MEEDEEYKQNFGWYVTTRPRHKWEGNIEIDPLAHERD
jgi:hypothetical protein